VNELLVDSRRKSLGAIKKAILSTVPELTSHLTLLSPVDLQLFLGGHEFLSSDMIKPLLEFKCFPEQSSTPSYILQWLETIAPLDLKRFLLYVTEQETVPLDGLLNPNKNSPYSRDKITIIGRPYSEDLPCSHACFYQLDVPDYNNQDKLYAKFSLAIQNAE
jgi:hypothetical protein